MKKRISLIWILVFGIPSVSLAAEGIWTMKEDMPTARTLLSTSVVDGKIYAIGGGPSPYAAYSVVEEYDPITDTWTRKADMSTERFALGTSVVNGKIYAIGGVQTHTGPAFSTVEEYDPKTDTWTTRSEMPTARGMLSTSSVDGKIYAIGGARSTHGPVLSIVEEYDPKTDTWTRKADLPETKYYHSASVVNGKIYVISGAAREGIASQTMYEYDPVSDTYTRKADILTATAMLSTSVVDGKIYAIGGDPPVVEEYDPKTDTWMKKADMLTPRALLSTNAVNGKIYAIGGSRVVPGTSLSTVEEYDTGLSIPQPDFNGDSIVDMKDLLRLIESWGQDDPLIDIAPLPFGDGIVDDLDLELLMSYWGQPFDDPSLLAHWALDETEGIIAYDSAGVCDAYLNGDPAWQPDTGMVGGALMFNGINDYAFAPLGLSPSDGPFSIFAWVKGGAPGQVIFSQSNGANWLMADSNFGCVATELIPPAVGRFRPQALESESVITDDQWHRIGFVWDGSNRALYVDDILVAEDIQEGLADSSGILNIGCGSNLIAGTFWSGLIDDVRIYDRVVCP